MLNSQYGFFYLNINTKFNTSNTFFVNKSILHASFISCLYNLKLGRSFVFTLFLCLLGGRKV